MYAIMVVHDHAQYILLRLQAKRSRILGNLEDVASCEVSVSAGQDWAMRAVDVDAALLRLSAAERQALLLVASGISYRNASES
jgi:RNA polymerase sigma-70 factor (ECF subfamily)